MIRRFLQIEKGAGKLVLRGIRSGKRPTHIELLDRDRNLAEAVALDN
jgi:hypothetical protein